MFLKLQDVQPETELLFSAMLPAYIFPVAYGTIGLIAALVLAVFVAPTWMALRPKGPYPANVAAGELLDPAVVQTNYNRQRPLLLSARFLPIVPFLLVPFLANHQAVRNLAMAMSEIVNLKSAAPTTPLLIMPFGGLFLAVSYGCAWIAKRTLRRRDNAPADSPSVDSKGAKDAELPQMGYLRIITGGMVVFPLIFLIPAVRNLDSTQRILLVGLLLGTVYITAAIVGLRSAKRVRKDLVAGDPMYDLVMEMAERANVSVRHVVVTDSRSANAYASIFGTVGLTSRLLENFDTDEIRAIVAHELGHLRARHVHKTFLTGLAMVGGYFVLVFAVLPYFRIGHNPSVELLLRTPAPAMLFSSLFVPLLTGKTMRRREQEADRFAVALTGDPDLVIRTLRKIHTINQTPHMLKPSDEVLASHPSLAHRIDAIRSQCEASVTK